MSKRCTENYIMTKDGQVDLARFAVYALQSGRSFRVQNSLALNQASLDDPERIRLIQTPLGPGGEHEVVTVAHFTKDTPLGTGAERRTTTKDRLTGSNHLDRPRGEQEITERHKVVTKALNGAGSHLKPAMREKWTKTYTPQLKEVCERVGTRDVLKVIAARREENPTIHPKAMMGELKLLTSMAEAAGVPEAESQRLRGGDGGQMKRSQELDTVNPQVGETIAAPIVVGTGGINAHARLRWDERVDPRLSAEHVALGLEVARANAARDTAAATTAKKALGAALSAAGLTNSHRAKSQKFITDHLERRTRLPREHPMALRVSSRSVGPDDDGLARRFVLEGKFPTGAPGSDQNLCLVLSADSVQDGTVRVSVVTMFYDSPALGDGIWDGVPSTGPAGRSDVEDVLATAIFDNR